MHTPHLANGNGTHEDESAGIRLQQTWRSLVRHRWLVMGVALATLAAGAAYTWSQRRVYESEATIRIEEQNTGQNLLGGMAPSALGGGRRIETEMAVLRSRSIAEQVVDTLGMRLFLEEPRAPGSAVVRPLTLTRTAPAATLQLELRDDGRYALSVEKADRRAAHPQVVEIGRPFSVGEAVLVLEPRLKADAPERIRLSILPFRAAVGGLQSALTISRPDPRAQVVSIRYRSTDPQLAAGVPNAAVDAFVAYKRRGSKLESRSAVDFLQRQVAAYERDLETAENSLRSFRERERVVSPQEEASEQVKRLAEQQATRDALRAERDALAQLLTRVSRGGQAGGAYRQLSSFPLFLSNTAVQNILQSLTDLENRRSQLTIRRTEQNEDIEQINTRIRELELELYQIARNYLSGLDSQLSSLDATLARFGNQLEAIPAREVEFARLSRQTTLLGEIYTLLQTRLKEAELKEAVEPADVLPLDEALEPLRPVGPRRLRNLVLSGILGLLLGVGIALLRDMLDTKVRTKEDVLDSTGGMPVLGTIPRIRTLGPARRRDGGKVVPVQPEAFLSSTLVTRLEPRNPASEAYRALRTNLTFASAERQAQVLVVTSAMPGDGKSTSSANLAITMAQQGVRTLLVDADLRRGVLHTVFGLSQEPGLSHLLLGRGSLADTVQHVPLGESEGELHFLATGVFPPNPAEMLGSERMRRLVDDMRQSYQMIIFDAPPVNLVTDAAVLTMLADAALLVARAGTTDKGALHHAASQLHHLRTPISGVILNGLDVNEPGYGYGYGYTYGEVPTETAQDKRDLVGANGNGRHR